MVEAAHKLILRSNEGDTLYRVSPCQIQGFKDEIENGARRSAVTISQPSESPLSAARTLVIHVTETAGEIMSMLTGRPSPLMLQTWEEGIKASETSGKSPERALAAMVETFARQRLPAFRDMMAAESMPALAERLVQRGGVRLGSTQQGDLVNVWDRAKAAVTDPATDPWLQKTESMLSFEAETSRAPLRHAPRITR